MFSYILLILVIGFISLFSLQYMVTDLFYYANYREIFIFQLTNRKVCLVLSNGLLLANIYLSFSISYPADLLKGVAGLNYKIKPKQSNLERSIFSL